jgi:8-oxo-dGTP pyrophosphatase MutT (NUDIX family)
MAIIERDRDGAMLFLRQTYRGKWTIPGGLLKRGEDPTDGLHREVREETGLEVSIKGEPRLRVDPNVRQIDVIFKATVAGSPELEPPESPEILETRWFQPNAFPTDLQMEAARALRCWEVPLAG